MFCKKVFTWSCKWLCSESIFKEGVYLFCCWSFVIVHRLSFRMNLGIFGHRYYAYSSTQIILKFYGDIQKISLMQIKCSMMHVIIWWNGDCIVMTVNNVFLTAVALFHAPFSLALLNTPPINITQDSCFTFYTMAGYSRYIPSLLRVVRNESNTLSSLASFDTNIKNFWIRHSVNVSQGEFGLLFEFSPLHSTSLGGLDFVYIDDVQLRDGYCTKQGKLNFKNRSSTLYTFV